tara:strand:+ start:219 stop:803 length:585 start_codon:yes stop_codon:yes gene_type:complete
MIPFPNKKYNIIYADPPWSYKVWTAKGGHKSASAHYNVMDIEDIKSLPVHKIADKDCVLFIWVTFPNLVEGIDTLQSWGFTYKTCGFVWVKTNRNYSINQTSFLPTDSLDTFMGLGYWTRANSELCLIGTKGKIRRENNSVHQIIYDPLREHSRKPDCTREKIVKLMGDKPRIELFARRETKGWDVWGNEVCMT